MKFITFVSVGVIKQATYVLLSLALISCSQSENGSSPESLQYSFSGPIMGTSFNIKIVSSNSLSSNQIDSIESSLVRVLESVDQSMSTYKSDSDVSRFNSLPLGEYLTVTESTADVISLSLRLNEFSQGYFDPTVGPLVDLWGFGAGRKAEAVMPSNSEIQAALKVVGVSGFQLKGSHLSRLREVEIDLSAVAKGYASDKVADKLQQLGFDRYMVEVGGEVVVNGLNARGTHWVLGIEAPEKNQRKVYNAVGITQGGMATSGDYRNFVRFGGKEYSHTINPSNGQPVKSSLASVTVITKSCAEADALATALMAMGDSLAIEFAEKHNLSAFFILRHENQFISKHTAEFKKYLL